MPYLLIKTELSARFCFISTKADKIKAVSSFSGYDADSPYRDITQNKRL